MSPQGTDASPESGRRSGIWRWTSTGGLIGLAATVYVLPFYWQHLWPLGLAAMWPIIELTRGLTPRQAAARGYVLGLAIMAAGVFWVRHVTSLGLVLMCAFLALYFALFCALMVWTRSRLKAPVVWAAPCLWVAVELARCNLITPFPWLMAPDSGKWDACLASRFARMSPWPRLVHEARQLSQCPDSLFLGWELEHALTQGGPANGFDPACPLPQLLPGP